MIPHDHGPDCAEIPLSRGFVAIVDAADAHLAEAPREGHPDRTGP